VRRWDVRRLAAGGSDRAMGAIATCDCGELMGRYLERYLLDCQSTSRETATPLPGS
jgi:hypothetical protein